MSTRGKSDDIFNLLIISYIHSMEQQTNLFMIIPKTIYTLIVSFYPKLKKFELYSNDYFKVSNDGHELQGTGGSCSGYTIYPYTVFPNGYSKGVHVWSVKLLGKPSNKESYCYHSIGVVSDKREEIWLTKFSDAWPPTWINDKSISTSCFIGNGSCYWGLNDTLTVKLDCDRALVEYFKNGILKQEDTIEKNKSFYFAMNTCASTDNRFQVVMTPINVWKNHSNS